MAKKGSSPDVSKSPASEAVSGEIAVAASEISGGRGKYTVVARRYRPKTFAELVGQSTVSQALLSAIESDRVGHAYLFTGARGVGKTSTARIFAKALNAAAETNGVFDPRSDISQAIDAGEDMDVLEIDGASNRGIDEIRQLRSNASVRPSRSRYKIYIIDEVHMLTTQAFNALLKTLEEPPGHVKFIFCTTDPEKIPITVLSRCQRFDFPPVQTEQIFERLKFICECEGTKADEAALRLIARRAAGSMRDSQSLLEQLLSFAGNQITVEVVHSMLGTADETRLASFSARLIERDAAGALRELNTAADEGVDVGQLAEQLLGYLRDMMTVTVGGSADLVRTANPNSVDQLKEWGKSWGTMTLLSALQLLDETIVKMRHSVQSRILLEVALVQICNLQDLQALSDLVRAFSNQAAPPPRMSSAAPSASASSGESKKKVDLASAAITPESIPEKANAAVEIAAKALGAPKATEPSAPSEFEVITPAHPFAHCENITQKEPVEAAAYFAEISNVSTSSSSEDEAKNDDASITSRPVAATTDKLTLFRECAMEQGGLAGQSAMMATQVECPSEQHWRILLSRDGSMALNYFQTGDNGRKLAVGVSNRIGGELHFEYILSQDPTPVLGSGETTAAIASPPSASPSRTANSQAQLIRNAMVHPLIKQFMVIFEAQVIRVDPAQPSVSAPHLDLPKAASSFAEDTSFRETRKAEVVV